MKFFNDVYRFFSVLSFVDIIFFVAIITLLILLVILVYFIKINREVLDEDDLFPPNSGDNNKKVEDKKLENMNDQELAKIVDNMKLSKEEKAPHDEYNDEEGELLDLESLTKKLQMEEENDRINCTEYEKDQEEKAIISYDELLQKHNRYAINYEKEEVMDDLVVRKVNLNDLINKDAEEEKQEVRVISYQKEEAFLSALKELNSLLN